MNKWFLYRQYCLAVYIKETFPSGEWGPPKVVDEVFLNLYADHSAISLIQHRDVEA